MLEKSYEVLHEFDRNTEAAVNVNTQLLMTIINDSRDTEYGKKYGFSEIHDAEEYRKRVPLTTSADYAQTSGKPKYIPVSDRGLEVFRKYSSSLITAVISEFHRTTRLKEIPDGFRFVKLTQSKPFIALRSKNWRYIGRVRQR